MRDEPAQEHAARPSEARSPSSGQEPPSGRLLAGTTVVVTRPAEQAASLARPLEALGAEVLLVPTIRIVPRPLDDKVRRILAGLGVYQCVVFTSVNGVAVFFGYLEELGAGPAALAGAATAAIGPATAQALEDRGIPCDVVPEDYIAEGLLTALDRRGIASAGARVLIPRAREARSVLPDTLREHGALVDVLPVYDTLPADELAVPAERIEAADFITFTSSSTVREFVRLIEAEAAGAGRPLAERLAGARLCSIGPITSATLREHGLPVAIEASTYTTAGLVAAISAAAGS